MAKLKRVTKKTLLVIFFPFWFLSVALSIALTGVMRALADA